MRRAAARFAFLVSAMGASGCDGGGTPPMIEQCSFNLGLGTFAPGDTIPGFVLAAPGAGRNDVAASGTWSNGTWTVLFTRALAPAVGSGTDDVDFTGLATGTMFPFSVAVLDNMGGAYDATMSSQNFGAFTLGNVASGANLQARNVAGPPVTAPRPNPLDPNWGAAFTKPAGVGIAGTATGTSVTLRAAFDSTNLYLLAVWSDATKDDRKEHWAFDGAAWARRSDKGADGSWATRDADGSQWDEDRLAIWWNISVTNFATGGCQVLCHSHRMGTHTLGEKADLWHWKAARSNPVGYADDQRLNDATFGGHTMAGRSDDTGTGIATTNATGSAPTSMSELDPGANARALLASALPIRYRSTQAFAAAGFVPNSQIPGFVLAPPTLGRADALAVGTWENDQWKVLFTRPLATSSSADDRQFGGLPTGSLYSFSVAVLDNMGGAYDATMLSQHTGPLTMGDLALQPGANLRARPVASAPTRDPNDPKWGPPLLKPAGPGIAGTATGAVVILRAAYDSNNLYVLAIWNDTTESDSKQSWTYDGSTWTRRSSAGTDGSLATMDADGSQWDEDRLAIWWDISVTSGNTGPFATQGCLTLCHQHRMGSHVLGEKADLWHWKAARSNPMGYVDDQCLSDATFSGHTMAGRSNDTTGTGVETNNVTGTSPTSMADIDPNANARYLFSSTVPTGPNIRRTAPFVASAPTKTCVWIPATGGGSGGATVSFRTQLDPLFASNCVCHRNGGVQNGLNLDTYANLMAGGNTGSEVVPGNGAASLIYQKVSMTTPPVGSRMPLGGPYLSSTQQQMIKDWIDQGAFNN